MKKFYIIILFLQLLVQATFAQPKSHCPNDVAQINDIIATISRFSNRGERVAAAAELLVGKSSDDTLATDSLYSLSIDVDTFTPISFVNTALALADASGQNGGAEIAFFNALQKYSCRMGVDDGFPSLFYHTSDWLGDNIYRGNLTELTDKGDARSTTASLDYLSVHPDEFAPLKNPDVYDKVRMTEMGFRSHRIPYLPKQAAGDDSLFKSGDIVILVNLKNRSDYYTVGIIKVEDDGPHLIHLDPKSGKVVKQPDPLKRYFNSVAKYFSGFRLAR